MTVWYAGWNDIPHCILSSSQLPESLKVVSLVFGNLTGAVSVSQVTSILTAFQTIVFKFISH